MPNEELLDNENEDLEEDENSISEEHNNEETTEEVVLLKYRSKEEIIKEIDSYSIGEDLLLEEKVNKVRFLEELNPLIEGINFEENILLATFEGNEEDAAKWTLLQKAVTEKLKSLPKKKDYVKSKIAEDKRKVDEENRKRKEAAKPKLKQKDNKEKKEEDKPKSYKYPFILHFAGHNVETDHIFKADKEYTPAEITKKMLEHQYYEFAGSVTYTYIEKDNVLIPIFQQYKKG